ncbi:hypothetical protein GPECTOR_18g150 [Gonium pectorale]|uniref:Protein kinase domain-containing protein n=1 Tax=Gonium pectorale TaxID=33097 RepID=A0A150GJY2_GONPE|nr:hypothetical protein GPECTOR_18g150 [Gonium pectorale]|eukprot:KXZ49995.1 hypothetical protein GPECTOR_18g150 [Gonium pectorale]
MPCHSVSSPDCPNITPQAGPGYLYYPRLTAPTSAAVGLNVTCPPDDWTALLAAFGGSSSNSSTGGALPALAPCGTATVSSGAQLLSALQALQPGHARVLLTLAANISLPASPTPQRAEPAPGDDDAVPLAVVYRNVTLAGAVRGATELDTRLRRNAFGLRAGWELLQSGGAQLPPLAAAAAEAARAQPAAGLGSIASAPVWKGLPVLVVADLAIVRAAPGPLASWPVGLMGLFYQYAGFDRSGGAGLQLITLRSRQVFTLQGISYISYWGQQLLSTVPTERESAAWIRSYLSSYFYMPDALGGSTLWSWVSDFALACNASTSPVPVLTPPTRFDYDLWSPSPAGLLAASGVNGSVAASPPLPPSSFAVASNASRLLALLQESWSGGPRVILVTANITLQPDTWPKYGARLSYNVTLAGPAMGEAVQLDTAGLPLVQPAPAVEGPTPSPSTAADAAGAGSSAVIVQLQRLTLRGGTSPPLLLSAWADVAAASAGLTDALKLRSWDDGCLGRYAEAAGSSASRQLLWEVRNCRLVLGAASLRMLRYYNAPEMCPATADAVADTPGADDADAAALSAAIAVCAALRSQTPGRLAQLLAQTLAVKGKADFHPANASGGPVEASGAGAIAFGLATLGSATLANSTALVAADDGEPSWAAPSAAEAQACSAASLLEALGSEVLAPPKDSSPPPPPTAGSEVAAPAKGSSTGAGAIVGGAVGGGEQASGVRPLQGVTMADQVLLGGKLPAGALGGGGFGGAMTPPRGVLPPPTAGGQAAAGPPRDEQGLQPVLPPAALMATGGSVPSSNGPRSNLRSTVAEEIEAMMRKCQALASDSPASSQAKGRRLQLLGRGAYGAVYLGDWRGMPAAIKYLLLGAEASATRRERLVREVALTMTLQHAHVVPTYNFDIGAVKVDSMQAGPRLSAAEPGQYPEAADDAEVTALQLKLVMQYCDGGTLKAALQRGHFSSRSPPVPPAPQSSRLLTTDSAGAGATKAAAAVAATAVGIRSGDGGSVAAPPPAACEVTEISSTGNSSSTCCVSGAGMAGAAEHNPERSGSKGSWPLRSPLGREAGAAGEEKGAPLAASASASFTSSNQKLEWDDVSAAQDLPLCLLAALDIVTGLEYLHGRGVIHGDLTDNNVLLKATQPVLPTAVQPGSLSCDGLCVNGGLPGSQPLGVLSTRGSLDPPAARVESGHGAGNGPQSHKREGCGPQQVLVGDAAHNAAAQMLRFVFKIADFGLAVQLQGGSETHLSNMAQGTPFFAAPEVVQYGRLSPAADIYSFGVLLWLLLHGVSLGQIRHLLPRTAHAPIAPLLLRHACRSLPACAHALLASSLALEPERRPRVEALRGALQEALRDVAGPELSQMLLSAERREHLLPGRQ